MTIAICLKCGADKVDALTPCPKCGFNPETSTAEDQVMSILLSDPNFETELPEPEVQEKQPPATEVPSIPEFDSKMITDLTEEMETRDSDWEDETTKAIRRYAFPAVIGVIFLLAGVTWWFLR